MLIPIHKHDCFGCKLVGQFDGKDVYHCDHMDLCIRWGSRDSENKSLPISTVESLSMSHKVQNDWDRALKLYHRHLG